MSASRISRTITRIAYQIIEDTRGSDQLVIIGIDDRGFKLANTLASRLTDIYETPIRACSIAVKKATGTLLAKDVKDFSSLPPVRNKKVVIVDDVMYSGKTMYRALQQIVGTEEPEEVRLAALIDRGHRRYPVTLQYVGLYCPTKLQEHVLCRFQKSGVPESVWLEHENG